MIYMAIRTLSPCAGLLVLLMVLTGCSIHQAELEQPNAVASIESDRLYAKARDGQSNIHTRRVHARKLARQSHASGWVVWMLMAKDPFQRQPGDQLGLMEQFDNSVLAALIDSLPADVPPEVALALTYQLENESNGRWCEQSFKWGVFVRSMKGTPPLREIARDKLKEMTGKDFEYDVNQWREAILEKGSEGAPAYWY